MLISDEGEREFGTFCDFEEKLLAKMMGSGYDSVIIYENLFVNYC